MKRVAAKPSLLSCSIVSGPVLRLSAHAWRGDATNSNIWQNRKLSTLEIQSAYVSDFSALCSGEWAQGVRSATCIADVLAVGAPTAAGNMALVLKQLQGMGCPSWTEAVASHQAPPRHGEQLVTCLLSTSDCGPDQAATRKHIHAAVADSPGILYIDTNCLIHQSHLICRSGLKFLDRCIHKDLGKSFRYYSTLAKICHLWQDNAARMFAEWHRRFGAHSSIKNAERPPPRCIAGRWGSCHETEERLLKPGADGQMTTQVLAHVLRNKRTNAAEVLDHPAEPAVDEHHVEEMQMYRAKLNKWSSSVLGAIFDPTWWALVNISYATRKPLMKFLLFQQRSTAVPGKATGSTRCCTSLVGLLAVSKAAEIEGEFSLVAQDASGILASALDAIPEDERQHVNKLAAFLNAHYAAGFHKRIVSVVNGCPRRMSPSPALVARSTMPCHAMPCHATPRHAMPCQTRPDQTRPDQTRTRTRPDQTRPDQTMPDQTMPDQTRPDCTTS